VRIIFEPSKPGEGYRFVSEIVGGAVPKDYVPGVERGLESARQNGLTAGFPVIDFRATLVDGAFHDTDSSEVAFEVAARAAFGALRDLAAPKLLEPIMTVEVVAPDACIGDAIGDLNTRRGQIQRIEALGFSQAIYAKVPLARLMGFATDLDTMTNGEGSFRIEFDSYEVAPRDPWPPPDDNFPSAMAMRA
jgi:elongation factor G